MKSRKYIQGITFFVSTQMYKDLKKASDELEISLSEFFRNIITEYFENRPVGNSATPGGHTAKEVMSDELIKK